MDDAIKCIHSVPRKKRVIPAATSQTLTTLHSLLFNEMHSDIRFICKDDPMEPIYAHKCILAASSEFYKNMFEWNKEENIETVTSRSLMRCLLKFIYTGSLDLETNNPFDMLLLAEEYSLPTLFAMCEQICIENISLDMVLQCIEVSYEINATDHAKCRDLLEASFEFLKKNQVALLDYSPFDDWKREKKKNNRPLWDAFLSGMGEDPEKSKRQNNLNSENKKSKLV